MVAKKKEAKVDKVDKKANKKTNKEVVNVVTIVDLAKELKTEPRTLRVFIRKLGLRAPETGIEGFGPKRKYEWDPKSKELAKIKKAWKDAEETEEEEDEEDDGEIEYEDNE